MHACNPRRLGGWQGKFATHPCAPSALSWGADAILATGSNQVVTFYDSESGSILQEFDHSHDDEEQDFTVAEFNPSGLIAIVGGFNRLHIFMREHTGSGEWEELESKLIDHLYAVSALAWKIDGSRLVLANVTGAVEVFDCCLRRVKYKNAFEYNYISPSQVIVRRLSNNARIVLKSHYGYEIRKINIFQDQYLVANTSDTLLLGDLVSCKLSEVGPSSLLPKAQRGHPSSPPPPAHGGPHFLRMHARTLPRTHVPPPHRRSRGSGVGPRSISLKTPASA
jgi:intraflagellar transport protein 172